jgi:hypothetical protein
LIIEYLLIAGLDLFLDLFQSVLMLLFADLVFLQFWDRGIEYILILDILEIGMGLQIREHEARFIAGS